MRSSFMGYVATGLVTGASDDAFAAEQKCGSIDIDDEIVNTGIKKQVNYKAIMTVYSACTGVTPVSIQLILR
jgi:hypothetical protein